MRKRTSSVRGMGVLAAWVLGAIALLPLSPAAMAATPADVDPALSSVTASPLLGAVADGKQEVTILVTVRNSAGQPLQNRMVRVSSSQAADKVVQPVAPTDAQGRAIATLASEVAGTRVVWATVDPDGDAIEIVHQPQVGLETPLVRPNILIIMVDDVGTDSLSIFDEVNPYRSDLPYVHGSIGAGDAPGNGPGTSNLYVHSPNLQALANQGVTFLNAYAMPVCSPARASLLTGNYPVRTGMGNICNSNFLGGTMNEFGDPGFEFPTLAQMAKSVDYAEIIIGKWHLGLPTADMYQPPTNPPPGSEGYLGWASIPQRGHFTQWMCVLTNVDTPPEPAPSGTVYNFFLSRNQTNHATVAANPETEFVTTVLFDEALAWCNTRTKPFVCLLTPTAAHSPWGLYPPLNLVPTEEYVAGPHNAWSGQMAQIEALDAKLGDLIDGLTPSVRQKTTIIFLSDNGIPKTCLAQARLNGSVGGVTGSGKVLGETYDFLLDAPEERFKGSVYERGTRVPMIVAGYGVTNPGRVSTALVDVTDIYPTVAELIDAEVTTEVHGISFKPILDDEVDYDTHARNYTYVEQFWPLGSTGPGIEFSARRIGCSLRIPGQGRYKIVHDQSLSSDRFYKLQDAAGNYVDPFETVDLPHGPGSPEHANYLLVLEKMLEVVASGDDSGPLVCSSSTNFCSSNANSTGAPAVISVAGSCSITLNSYTLRATPVPNQFGIFFYSQGKVNGGNGLPYGNGLRCVGGAGNQVFRLPITEAVSNLLEYKLDFGNLPLNGNIYAGSTWHFQAWFRDPLGGGENFNLSDAQTTTFTT